MYWPTPQDYREAIQNPRNCFKDPELQAGLPELDKLGLPRPISGSFASVYKLKCGEQEWAVRCFTNNVKDQKIRYDAISLHLRANPLPYLVPFEYLSEGININGQWFPVVKMKWVEGETLLTYIERHLNHHERLQELSGKWLTMTRELRAARIAHGDLQHGNILIHNDEIILIDYDGMYVPALQGMTSNELGHRNYQHPGRTEAHFGPYIDYFSEWVIWISLAAVCADPSLWHSLGAGEAEESLLFRRNDFVSPDASRAFELLAQVEDEAVRSNAGSLHGFSTIELPEVPSLPDPQLSPHPRSRQAPPLRSLPQRQRRQRR
ncbi:RIO1 family regulatory kinase/ATPase domain-containing protein [Paenibacillus silvisoli]|uniref:RIO1 family regulatory kinase/ATPase domain-containing protein n=1 Tax=Paenibacillus silvisoli TaxID=3110539 RepID=UPI0028039FDB|nr:RIO1 family regulatory kinase/ATPase [Paenibacillus silvisoli]